MKDHEIAKIVNEATTIARDFGQTQQLRERMAALLVPALRGPAAAGDVGTTDMREGCFSCGIDHATGKRPKLVPRGEWIVCEKCGGSYGEATPGNVNHLTEWIDPEGRKEVTQLPAQVYAAVRGNVYHKILATEATQDKHLDEDGGPWEMFAIGKVGVIGERKFYWGMFLLGAGFFNVMIPAEQARALRPHEREKWANQGLSMFGSHTGKLSYTMSSGVETTDQPLP